MVTRLLRRFRVRRSKHGCALPYCDLSATIQCGRHTICTRVIIVACVRSKELSPYAFSRPNLQGTLLHIKPAPEGCDTPDAIKERAEKSFCGAGCSPTSRDVGPSAPISPCSHLFVYSSLNIVLTSLYLLLTPPLLPTKDAQGSQRSQAQGGQVQALPVHPQVQEGQGQRQDRASLQHGHSLPQGQE